MIDIILIVFTITLLYFVIANRLMTYVNILVIQGVLLFGVAFLELHEINVTNLIFILLETLVVKTIAIPMFLRYIIKKNNIEREAEPYLPSFASLIIITIIIVTTFVVSNVINDTHLNKIYFVVALSTIFSGLYFITTRKKIVTHVICYVIIENGVFILSLAVGTEMPLLVNLGILLDVFVSVFLLGIFINKIGNVMQELDISELNKLKD